MDRFFTAINFQIRNDPETTQYHPEKVKVFLQISAYRQLRQNSSLLGTSDIRAAPPGLFLDHRLYTFCVMTSDEGKGSVAARKCSC